MTDVTVAPRPIAREETRRPITMDVMLALQKAGQVPYKRTQLLDGEIHEMPADGLRHTHYAMEIAGWMVQTLKPKGFFVGIQTTLHLSPYNGPSPDVYVLSPGPLVRATPSDRILLVVEVANTSLNDDLRDSASRYARHDVGEFWVVDVRNRITYVHRQPQNSAYASIERIEFEQHVRPLHIADFALRIADLDPTTPLDDD